MNAKQWAALRAAERRGTQALKAVRFAVAVSEEYPELEQERRLEEVARWRAMLAGRQAAALFSREYGLWFSIYQSTEAGVYKVNIGRWT